MSDFSNTESAERSQKFFLIYFNIFPGCQRTEAEILLTSPFTPFPCKCEW